MPRRKMKPSPPPKKLFSKRVETAARLVVKNCASHVEAQCKIMAAAAVRMKQLMEVSADMKQYLLDGARSVSLDAIIRDFEKIQSNANSLARSME